MKRIEKYLDQIVDDQCVALCRYYNLLSLFGPCPYSNSDKSCSQCQKEIKQWLLEEVDDE